MKRRQFLKLLGLVPFLGGWTHGAGSAQFFLPADRRTAWNPGMMAVGGIPVRNTIFTTVTPLGTGLDDTAQIQTAINNCPVGQVVALSAGTFNTTPNNLILINKAITLRGAGAGVTILHKLNGATDGSSAPGPGQSPIIVVGSTLNPTVGGSLNLSLDAVKDAFSVTLASTTGLSVGQFVLLDEVSGASFQTDRLARGQIWASPDYQVVWQYHNPASGIDDFSSPANLPSSPGSLGTVWCRPDRPNSEWHQISGIAGNIITFSTPIHLPYRVANTAQLSFYNEAYTTNAGVEQLSMEFGDSGNIIFILAGQCWADHIESSHFLNPGINIDRSFRIEIRHFYSHEACWPVPGGAGYAFSWSGGSTGILLEDGISVRANKVMVSRCSGAASVVGYCYMDEGYIGNQPDWIEIGLNASHMVGSHHVLFEGNYSFNADSDQTHGNSTHLTFFRNQLRGLRAGPFTDITTSLSINDATNPSCGPVRCGGMHGYGYQMSFVGNLLGASGQMTGFVYDGNCTTPFSQRCIWLLGYDDISPQPCDAFVAPSTIRDGNYDFLQNVQSWHNTPATFTIPNSLYLAGKPAFFGANPWPWTNPANGTINVLPAKARFDAGTPNA